MHCRNDCGRDIIHPNIWSMLLGKYVPGKSNWVLTDTDFLTKEMEYIKKKVLSLGYKDLKQIKTELIA
jgi:hypothetical protein